MFKTQPKIDVKPTSRDRRIIWAGWLTVVMHFVLVFYFYLQLPDTVPHHFDIKGEPDRFGNKLSLWTLPILGAFFFFGMNMLATKMKPWYFNYPTTVTEKNAKQLYALAIRMLIWLNFGISIAFILISVRIIMEAINIKDFGLGWMLLPIIFLLSLSPLIYIIKMTNIPKE